MCWFLLLLLYSNKHNKVSYYKKKKIYVEIIECKYKMSVYYLRERDREIYLSKKRPSESQNKSF